MERNELIDTSQRLCRTAMRDAALDRVVPGLDHFWILRTLGSDALRGALRRQLYVQWLRHYASRIN